MRTSIFILTLSLILSGLALPWLATEGYSVGGIILDNPEPTPEFLVRPQRTKHRLVAKLLCEEPVTTFLAVMSLHGSKNNAVTMVLTDVDGQQSRVEEVLQPDMPFRVSCEDVPVEFSQAAPVVVHVDSRYATSGMAMNMLRGSPIFELEAVQVTSERLRLNF